MRRKPASLADSFDWDPLLTADPHFPAAPVQCFSHAPMTEAWRENALAVGMKVEVENTDCEGARASGFADSFWVASVIRIAGYKAQLRYEGITKVILLWQTIFDVMFIAKDLDPTIPKIFG